LIKTAVAAGVVGAAGRMLDAQTMPSTNPRPATTQAQASSDAVTAADVAAVDKALGHDYSAADREMMARDMEGYRQRYRRFRRQKIDLAIEPAAHFDPRLPSTVVPTGKSSCTLSDGAVPAFDGNVESLAFCSVAELSRLIAARKVTSTQLTKMYLDRLRRFGPRLLCIVNVTEELALKQAARADEELAAGKSRGPLHGIPYGAKDLLATKGIRTTWGISPLKDQVFDFDATVVERLEQAGAVLIAKLSLGELAMGDIWYGGKTRNPWKPSAGSSGSSAGPGAATAAGLVGFSIGTETLGSIVSPCVENAVTGLRPTWGRVSRFGAMALTWTLDKLGPMCRGVEDCALVLSAIHGADPKDATAADVPFVWNPASDLKSLRVGFDARVFDWTAAAWRDESVKAIYKDALDAIRSLVGELRPIALPAPGMYPQIAYTIIHSESSSAFAELTDSDQIRELAQQERGSWPNTFRVGSTIPAADYLRVMRMRTQLMQQMAELMTSIDLYITVPFSGPTLVFTNLTGHPSLVTRCGIGGDGKPKMIELIGNLYREDAILRLGHAYEQATQWHTHWPKVDDIPEHPQ
jgi:Asp-tRNA(Asn)/Glu-tRNA(Gln) amidotransferase A subunit family amidase